MASENNTKRLDFLRDAWRLAKPYFVSDDKKWAWGLLAAVIALNLFLVFLNVRFNFWRNDFFNTFQNKDEAGFFKQLGIFTVLAVLFIATGVYATYLQQMLQIRWRRWLTRQYLHDWLEGKAYYRLQLTGAATDNPDQRIAEDLNRFTDTSLSLTLGLLNSVVTLFSFVGILWELSGPFTFSLGGTSITIPAYMVWFAILYAIVGTLGTIKIGRPLVALNFAQQRYEADFRFSLVRLRENAESVALYGGEPREHAIFIGRFTHVVDNFWAIMRRIKALGWWTYFYGQFAVIFPYLVSAPRFFSGAIQLGGLMQIADAFGQVQSSLSFVINSYTAGTGANDTGIAAWRAVVQRLVGFDDRVRAIAAEAQGRQPIDVEREGQGVAVSGLDLALPDGAPLLQPGRSRGQAGRGGARHRSDRQRQEHLVAGHRRHLALRQRRDPHGRGQAAFPAAKALSAARHAARGADLSGGDNRSARQPAGRSADGGGARRFRAAARRGRQLGAAPVARRATASRLRPRAPGAARSRLPRRGDLGARRGERGAPL